MTDFQLTPEMLATIAGAALSLLFSYIPGLNTYFAKLSSEAKRGIMALLLLVVAAAIFALGCANILLSGVACNQQGIIQLVWMFVMALIGNQAAFLISPPTKAVKDMQAQTPEPNGP